MKKILFVTQCFALLFVSIMFSCVFITTHVKRIDKKEIKEIILVNESGEQRSIPYSIKSSTKAHMTDGSMILFPNGFIGKGDTLKGDGYRYDLFREHSTNVKTIPMDSIAFLEYYKNTVQPGPILGGLTGPVLFLAAIQNDDIHKAFFGSCPTVYTYRDDKYHLQAECFSYSISPFLETDDLDRIEQLNILNDRLVLNVRNEAFETHYINQMKLLLVDHPEGYEPLPKNKSFVESKDQILLFGKQADIIKAVNKSGRDVSPIVSRRDDFWYQSDSTLVQGLTENVVKDWVEVVTKSPEHAKKIVIGVRFRNTLFHTVQFYDLVLNGFGAQALDWVGVSMADPLYRYQLIQWYQRYFGIEVCKWDGQEWVLEELVPDTGPIAWKQVAFELSVPEDPIVKIRFRFLPDNIQLDWIGVSYDISSDYKTQDVLCDQISPINNCQADIAPSMLFQRDDQYLITYPADSYFLSFHVGIPSNALSRTCFIKSYGYYIEWIRKDWLISASCGSDKPLFAFDESSIVMAAKAWTNKKTDFERIFFESKLMLRGDRLP